MTNPTTFIKRLQRFYANNRTTIQAWWQASRPPFYIATLIPIIAGYIQAVRHTGQWHLIGIAGILLVCLMLHLTANLANDLFDHWQGIDKGKNIGGSRVIQEGKISVRALIIALIVLYSGILLFTYLGVWYLGRPWIWAIIAFAMFSSFFYVAPPIKYGHRALGEVFVFLNMGIVMTTGTYYALTGGFSSRIYAVSLPIGLMVAGILYYQSLPEIDTDLAAGKHTLANTLGKIKARKLFYAWWPTVWLLLALLQLRGYCSHLVYAGILLSVPLYLRAAYLVRSAREDWLFLDKYGYLVRIMYLLCGLALLVSLNP